MCVLRNLIFQNHEFVWLLKGKLLNFPNTNQLLLIIIKIFINKTFLSLIIIMICFNSIYNELL